MMVALLDDVDAPRSECNDGEFLAVDRRIAQALASEDATSLEAILRLLIAAGLDRLPLPGHGATLKRWQALEQVARHDLAVTKLFEGHTDALAILQEIDTRRRPRPDALYAVWASEARTDPITIRDSHTDRLTDVRVDGRKSWCSGAATVDLALMTAVDARGARYLIEVALDDPGIRIDEHRWHAVGMRDSGSYDVVCEDVAGRVIGHADAYLERPGFWHGGAGIAACWYGAAAAIGTRMRDLQRGRDDTHALAHLGAVDTALSAIRALLRECAAEIDASPARDAMRIALRARNGTAELAETVIAHATRALGPGPLCTERALARLIADLPIFVRQSRAEHDLVAQSRALLADDAELATTGWLL